MRIRNHRDFWAGVLFIVTGLLFMALSRQYTMGTAAKMGPGYFPTVLGGIMAVLGVLILLPAFSRKSPEVRVTNVDLKSNFLVLLGVAVYAFTLPKLGFLIAAVLLIVIAAFAHHEFKFRQTVLLAIGLVIFSWLAFVKGLELQFPFLPPALTR